MSWRRCTAKPAGRSRPVYFSKHLQWLDWEQMAETAAELGFDGIDLTVREGGHVEPERVKEDLPKVAKNCQQGRPGYPDDHRRNRGRPFSSCGSHYSYRQRAWDSSLPVGLVLLVGYSEGARSIEFPRQPWKDSEILLNVPGRLDELKKRVAALAELNGKYKVCAMYHNHSGSMVGASVWDLWILLKDFDARWVSSNFDVGHATVEGGLGGWVNSTRLMAPFIQGNSNQGFQMGEKRQRRMGTPVVSAGRRNGELPGVFRHAQRGRFSGPCSCTPSILWEEWKMAPAP